MIFLRYESGREYVRQYPVNTGILIACLAMFAVEIASGGASGAFGTMNLLRLGAITNVPEFSGYWRYVAALFLHGGWSHLLFNLFAIFVFAPPLEKMFGPARYAVFYLLSGVLGNLAAVGLATGVWVGVGASTAIYAIYGAYLYVCLFQRERLDAGSRTTVYGILATGLVYSFLVPHVGYWAHIGGLVAGFVLYRLLGSPLGRR